VRKPIDSPEARAGRSEPISLANA